MEVVDQVIQADVTNKHSGTIEQLFFVRFILSEMFDDRLQQSLSALYNRETNLVQQNGRV